MLTTPEAEKIVVLLALGKAEEAVELENHFNRTFPGIMEIYRAPSGFDAMSLAMNRPRIVLLDQRLPDVMGLDMIEPIRDQIGAENFLIFIGGSGKSGMRPGMRDEALKRRASAICDRPIDLNWLTDMIRQLLFPEVPDHPHLHGLELLDLVQMFYQKRCNRTLRIFANDGRVGSIYMLKGQVTHIEAGGQQGFHAMLDVMRWSEGRIVVFDALLSPERTNTTPTEMLILEAARILDEGMGPDAGRVDVDAVAAAMAPPPPPAEPARLPKLTARPAQQHTPMPIPAPAPSSVEESPAEIAGRLFDFNSDDVTPRGGALDFMLDSSDLNALPAFQDERDRREEPAEDSEDSSGFPFPAVRRDQQFNPG